MAINYNYALYFMAILSANGESMADGLNNNKLCCHATVNCELFCEPTQQ